MQKNRTMRIMFLRSGETISRYFNMVPRAICLIRDDFVQPPTPNCHHEIESNPSWHPYFKDCIGLLDGTHIAASVPQNEMPRFHGRKGPTQNVLAVINPDLIFTYVLAGWEGLTNDFTVLRDGLSRPHPKGLRVIEGKYYLVDAGYTTMSGFIASYRGVRYHLKEHMGAPRQTLGSYSTLGTQCCSLGLSVHLVSLRIVSRFLHLIHFSPIGRRSN